MNLIAFSFLRFLVSAALAAPYFWFSLIVCKWFNHILTSPTDNNASLAISAQTNSKRWIRFQFVKITADEGFLIGAIGDNKGTWEGKTVWHMFLYIYYS